jgi:hypothetical protein
MPTSRLGQLKQTTNMPTNKDFFKSDTKKSNICKKMKGLKPAKSRPQDKNQSPNFNKA